MPPSAEPGSPLARFLGAQLQRKAITLDRTRYQSPLSDYDLAAIETAALALASAHPFDPTELTVTPGKEMRPGPESNISAPPLDLLSAALTLSEGGWTAGPTSTGDWPATLEGFSDRPWDSKDPPMERLAAVLTAAGCSPWTPLHPAGPRPATWDPAFVELPTAVHLAATQGLHRLLLRFLSLPGAWTAATVGAGRRHFRGQQLLTQLLKTPASMPALEALVARGARLDSEAIPWLEDACIEAIEALARHRAFPQLSAPQRRGVLQAWRKRSCEGALRPQQAARMAALLDETGAGPAVPDQSMSTAALAVAKYLTVAWGSRANGSSSMAYDFARDLGSAALVERAALPKRRGLTGEWSVLAAAAFSRVIQGENAAQGWSVQVMLGEPPSAGVLSDALGFEWRPDIPVDALVALALFGQRPDDTYAPSKNWNAGDRRRMLTSDLADFTLAAGISDLNAWSRAQVAPAAAATLAITVPASQSGLVAGNTLAAVWATWAQRMGVSALRTALDERTRADLLMALAPGVARHASSPARTRFTGLAQSLFPQLHPGGRRTGQALRGFFALSMVEKGLDVLPIVLGILEAPDWPEGLADDLQRYADSLDPNAAAPLRAAVELRRLDDRLPAGTPKAGAGRKPRI